MEKSGFRDFTALMKRRRRAFLVWSISIFVLVAAFALLWPPSYRSMATIQIVQAAVPQDLSSVANDGQSSALQLFADQQIGQIHQRIVTTSNLAQIIDKFDLYKKARKSKPIADIADAMKDAIKINLVGTDFANPNAAQRLDADQLAAIAFTVSFDYSNPTTAQAVTQELVSRFLEEDQQRRNSEAAAASEFLAKQISDLEATLAQQEKRMADFRAEHPGSLEEDTAFNMQMLSTSAQNITTLTEQLQQLDQQRGTLQGQIATTTPYAATIPGAAGTSVTPSTMLRSLQAQYAALLGQYGPDHPDVVRVRHQIDALQSSQSQNIGPDSSDLGAQIADARTKLLAARKVYGPDHPDVIALRHQLAALERLKRSSEPKSADPLNVSDADNPNYLMFKYQLSAIDSQYRSLSAQLAQAQQDHDHYMQLVAASPSVEGDYATLSRDYDNAQTRYRELKEKKLSADMNQQLEQQGQGQHLLVIESPDLPLKPHFPPKKIVIAVGLMLAVLGGFGGVQLSEAMNGAINSSRQLTDIVGVPPLVVIPRLNTKRDLRRRTQSRARFVLAVILAIAIALLLVHLFVVPLDVLWADMSLRMGLS